jgi:hypothetical protein
MALKEYLQDLVKLDEVDLILGNRAELCSNFIHFPCRLRRSQYAIAFADNSAGPSYFTPFRPLTHGFCTLPFYTNISPVGFIFMLGRPLFQEKRNLLWIVRYDVPGRTGEDRISRLPTDL